MLSRIRAQPGSHREAHAWDEGGVELIEFLAIFVIIIFVGLLILQFMVFAHVSMVAHSAAQEGARAAAVGESVDAAAKRSGQGFAIRLLEATNCFARGALVKVRLELRVPLIGLPGVELPEIWTVGQATAWCEGR